MQTPTYDDISYFLQYAQSTYGKWCLLSCIHMASKYRTIDEWMDKHPKSYLSALDKGWINQCSRHMKPKTAKTFPDQMSFSSIILSLQKNYATWCLEDCQSVATKFETTADWERNDPLSYMIATDKGWLSTCVSHMSTNQKKKAARAIPQSTRNRKQKAPAQAKAILEREQKQEEARKLLRHKFKNQPKLGVIKKTKKQPPVYPVPRAICVKSAFSYNTVREWKAAELDIYLSAKLHGHLHHCMAYMEDSDNEWTFEMCLSSAKHYPSEALWKESNPIAYRNAEQNDWLVACLGHMISKHLAPQWRVSDCLMAAAPFTNESDWRSKRPLSHQAATENNWLNRVIFQK